MTVPEVRARFATKFSDIPPSAHGKSWADLWDEGTFLPWDKGCPNPALEDILTQRRDDLLGGEAVLFDDGNDDDVGGEKKKVVKRRKKALVPGMGRGYDVCLLASFGYDAYGVDVSGSAVREAEREARQSVGRYPVRDEGVGRGVVGFLEVDFFAEGWLREEWVTSGEGFDVIYDYTFLSALHPSTRPLWALRMSQLLNPTGVLICVQFPSYKPPNSGGPPWGLPSSVYVEHLTHPGEELKYDENDNVIEEVGRPVNEKRLHRVAYWQPERTHEIGKGSDWVSVWKHPES
ncbi:MAG: hypothetical protein M1834_004431 [Cirrosporium novae-zelandiae]|nr:MAG: hypothetical protein M1834_004431 [Cirrosporium novae-zelandiae]